MIGAIPRYWHLLSLDAPTVAALWTLFVAKHAKVSAPHFISLFAGVWAIYAVDRLLDARIEREGDTLRERHRFHARHARFFWVGILFAVLGVGVSLVWFPQELLIPYTLLFGLLVAYFVLIHVARIQSLSKEIIVGLFFSASTFMPVFANKVVILDSAMLFGAACTLNCFLINTWEDDKTLFPFALPIVVFGAIEVTMNPNQINIACALSIAFLMLLHHARRRFDPLDLRIYADIALLTPLLFWTSPR
jgi:hypothetical protein